MNLTIRYFLILFILTCTITSCEDDDKKPKGQYTEGAFIVNEGAFGSGNGSITYYNHTTGEAEQNIFLNAVGEFAGDVVQSLTFADDKAYIVINNSQTIEVVNANTFISIETITLADELDKPRYIEVINDKAYISVWGPYDEFFSLVDSYVLVYDLNSGSVITTIDTDEGTENLLYNNQYLFASNFNYGASNTVSVIDPTDNSLVENIVVADGPAGMVTDVNGKLWVVCVGGWGAETGQLFRINPTILAIEEEITITGVPGMDLATTPDGDQIIYTVGKNVYALSIASTEEPAEALFESEDVVSTYSLNLDPNTGTIWIGDAPSFSSAGKVYVYSATGTSITAFNAGIGPTQIVFK